MMNMNTMIPEVKALFKEAAITTFTLLKIMIPISIIVKIMKETGIIDAIGVGLAPVMHLVGLPGDYGLVWATAMITNIYGGLVVFFTLWVDQPLTIAQVTVLAALLLMAHNLPVEVSIAKKAGCQFWFILLLRVFGAFVLAWIIYLMFSLFHIYQTQGTLLWQPGYANPSLLLWIWGECKNYLMIFLIILGLLILMKILKKTGMINRLNNLLEPRLKVLGMSKEAAPVTMIGMTLGLAYGGGLIINEAKSGRMQKKDIFLSLSLMSLSHSLIEDTLLMVAIGASVLGVLVGRVLVTIVIMVLLIQGINHLSEKIFNRYFIN